MDLFLPTILLFGVSLWSMVVTGKRLGRMPINPLWIVLGTMLGLAAPTLIVGVVLEALTAFHVAR